MGKKKWTDTAVPVKIFSEIRSYIQLIA